MNNNKQQPRPENPNNQFSNTEPLTHAQRVAIANTISNNKQNMKLYTEEQVLLMLNVCRDSDLYEHILTLDDILKTETPIELPSDSLCINCDDSKSTHNICMDCIIKIGKENIELPSDEQIEFAKGNAWSTYEYEEGNLYRTTFNGGFELGAKWMRDKIQGGNNEQL